AGRADFADVATGPLDYLLRDMRSPDGGFYSATDADSPAPSGADEEGYFFTWTRPELDAALGDELGATIAAYYGVTSGRSTLHVAGGADRLGAAHAPLAADLVHARELLFAARSHRAPPHLDDKIVTAWNGLAITALARGAIVLDRTDYAVAAARTASLLLSRLR